MLAVATSLATILTVSRASDNVFGSVVGWLFLAVFLVGVLYRIWQLFKADGALRSFVGSAIIIIGLAGIAAVGNFPDMVPARGTPPATSLTVERAASEDLTLAVMLILAVIFVPLVLNAPPSSTRRSGARQRRATPTIDKRCELNDT